MRNTKTASAVLATVAFVLIGTVPINAWAGAVTKRLYLASNGKANTAEGDGVLSWAPSTRQATDKYVFDLKDSRARGDVLVYTTTALERPVRVSGSIAVELYAASDVRDANFTAAIEDVESDGKVVPLGSKPVGIVHANDRPGKVAFYRIDLGTIEHAFLPGHRIRVEISSSAAPTLNPNDGNPIATNTDQKIVNQRVLHSIAHPSALVLRLVE